ncbi:MAG: hypothetical protein A2X48_09990 [Lentisphaerae bacterium GWF2_49_21]|nr:MAG: hypothetical protein A2X48_09990 [Lentisphaerae bacterium GWF2_49_21]
MTMKTGIFGSTLKGSGENAISSGRMNFLKLSHVQMRKHLRSSLMLLAAVLIGNPMFAQSAPPAGEEGTAPQILVVPDQVIVKYKAGANKALKTAAVHNRQGTAVKRKLSKRLGLDLLSLPKGADMAKVLASLNSDPDVEYAEPDYIVSCTAMPDDPYFTDGKLWSMHNTGHYIAVEDADIDAPEAWDIRTSAKDVVVAVVDTGIFYTHNDLKDNIWVNSGEIPGNGIDDDGNGYIDDVHGINAIVPQETAQAGNPLDDHKHGTHVAGTIGASGNNSTGVAGVVWEVKLMAVKFLDRTGTGTTSDAIQAVDYARQMGADIINCSWGGGGYSQSLQDAFRACNENGILVVCAAGNTKNDNDQSPYYPANYQLGNLVTVGATDNQDLPASFSSYGRKTVDLFAPGVMIYSSLNNQNSYTAMSGTSMATPHVSGALAMLRAQFPQESPYAAVNRIISGVDHLDKLSSKCYSGGRLNLYNALAASSPRPRNDNFANAIFLGNVGGALVRGNNGGATVEPGEPVHSNGSGKTVWYKWKAPASAPAFINTLDSGFNTIVSIYKGTSLAKLTLVASNDDDPQGFSTSWIDFNASANTNYYIAVDGANGAEGGITFEVAQPPSNSNFANAREITTAEFHDITHNFSAGYEQGEPNHAGSPASNSIWYRWTVPATGMYRIDTHGSPIDTLLGIYRGDSVGSLTEVCSADDMILGVIRTGQVLISAQKDEVYHIAVDGWESATGTIKFNIIGGDEFAPVGIGSTDAMVTVDGPSAYTIGKNKGTLTAKTAFDNACALMRVAEGEGELVMCVNSVQQTGAGGEIGLMIRQSLDDSSKHSTISLFNNGTVWNARFINRLASEGITSIVTDDEIFAAPTLMWLKLRFQAGDLTAYFSTDGNNWTQIRKRVFDFTGPFYVGVVAVGNNNKNAITASIDNLEYISYTDGQ